MSKEKEFASAASAIIREIQEAPSRGGAVYVKGHGWLDKTGQRRLIEAAQRSGGGSALRPGKRKAAQAAPGQGSLFGGKQKGLFAEEKSLFGKGKQAQTDLFGVRSREVKTKRPTMALEVQVLDSVSFRSPEDTEAIRRDKELGRWVASSTTSRWSERFESRKAAYAWLRAHGYRQRKKGTGKGLWYYG